jgi:hypothetical protein
MAPALAPNSFLQLRLQDSNNLASIEDEFNTKEEAFFEMEPGGLGGKPSPRGGHSGEPDLQHLAKMVLALII